MGKGGRGGLSGSGAAEADAPQLDSLLREVWVLLGDKLVEL